MAIPRIELGGQSDVDFLLGQAETPSREMKHFFEIENPGLGELIDALVRTGANFSKEHDVEAALYFSLIKLVQLINAYDDLIAKRLLEE